MIRERVPFEDEVELRMTQEKVMLDEFITLFHWKRTMYPYESGTDYKKFCIEDKLGQGEYSRECRLENNTLVEWNIGKYKVHRIVDNNIYAIPVI